MANDATNVRVGLGGSKVYFDASGAGTLPTDAVTALDAAFVDVGHIGEEGFTYAESLTTSSLVDSAGNVVRTFTTEHDVTFNFVMLETKALTESIYYGDAAATDSEVTLNNYDGRRGQWVVESLDGVDGVSGTIVSRFALADGQVTDKGEVNFQKDDAIGYDITLTSYISGGNKGKKYRAAIA